MCMVVVVLAAVRTEIVAPCCGFGERLPLAIVVE